MIKTTIKNNRDIDVPVIFLYMKGAVILKIKIFRNANIELLNLELERYINSEKLTSEKLVDIQMHTNGGDLTMLVVHE